MSGPGGIGGAGGAAPARLTPDEERAKLRTAAHQLEGVFLSQLFKAMRDTVPAGESGPGSEGREMFTSMLDDTLAQRAAGRMSHGLGEALYRQLSRRLDALERRAAANSPPAAG
jgi:flagellar protein FlgJ